MGKLWNSAANCMGWALQTPEWVRLNGYLKFSHYKTAEKFGIEYGLKPVQKKDMVLGKEYIAMRITSEDYHFMKRGKHGHWTHKRGPNPVQTISQKDVFAATWVNGWIVYGGPIWLFEVS